METVLVFAAARLTGLALGDLVLTRDEIDGLMTGHLVSADPPAAATRLTGGCANTAIPSATATPPSWPGTTADGRDNIHLSSKDRIAPCLLGYGS